MPATFAIRAFQLVRASFSLAREGRRVARKPAGLARKGQGVARKVRTVARWGGAACADRPRLARLSKLSQRGEDTRMAVSSDLMSNALEGYAVLKVTGKGQGVDDLRKMLATRFARGPRTPAAPITPAEPAVA